jgi:hypothetical protein
MEVLAHSDFEGEQDGTRLKKVREANRWLASRLFAPIRIPLTWRGYLLT